MNNNKQQTEQDTGGTIDLGNGWAFVWMMVSRNRTFSVPGLPEVYGLVRQPDGLTVKGSAGYYRTDDPQAAAKRALYKHPQAGTPQRWHK